MISFLPPRALDYAKTSCKGRRVKLSRTRRNEFRFSRPQVDSRELNPCGFLQRTCQRTRRFGGGRHKAWRLLHIGGESGPGAAPAGKNGRRWSARRRAVPGASANFSGAYCRKKQQPRGGRCVTSVDCRSAARSTKVRGLGVSRGLSTEGAVPGLHPNRIRIVGALSRGRGPVTHIV